MLIGTVRWIAGKTETTDESVPELVGGHLAQLVELDLLGEDIERDVDRAA